MNKIYRCVYNESLGAWVAVSELAHARGKRSRGRLSKVMMAASLALGGVIISSTVFADDDIVINQTTNQSDPISETTESGLISITSSANLTVSGTTAIWAKSHTGGVSVIQTGQTSEGVTPSISASWDGINVHSWHRKVEVDVAGLIDAGVNGIVTSSESGTIFVTQAGDSQIDADQDGINANNLIGNVTVDVAGAINTGNDGIDAFTEYGDIFITQAEGGVIEAENDGIHAGSLAGNVTVDVAGSINAGNDGIAASAQYGDILLTQTESSVIAAENYGIAADSDAGNVTVDVAGAINVGEHGVNVSAVSGDVSVMQAESGVIKAENDGINVQSTAGSVTVNTTGSITAEYGIGIQAHGDAGDVLVAQGTDGNINAYYDGIDAQSYAGNVTVNVDGYVHSGEDGVSTYTKFANILINQAEGGVINAHDDYDEYGSIGISAETYDGTIGIDVAGIVDAEREGISVKSSYGNLSVGQAESSSISAEEFGIYVKSKEGNVSVDAAGTIESDGDGVYAESGLYFDPGTYPYGGTGTVSVTSAGDIQAGTNGINANSDAGTITINQTAGDIVAGDNGINAYSHKGDISITRAAGAVITAEGDGILAYTGTGNITVNNAGTITSLHGNGINLDETSGNNFITNSSDISAIHGYSILTGQGNDTLLQNIGTITGDIYLGSGDDILTANGGAIVGGIGAGVGSDIVTLNAPMDVSKLTYLDGDSGIATTPTLGAPPVVNNADIDTLNLGVDLTGSTFANADGTVGNVAINNWEYINVLDSGTLRLSGNLDVPYSHLSAPDTYSLTINEGGTLALAKDLLSATVNGDVDNRGTIDLHIGDAKPENLLTITGNYAAGSDLIVDVNLATGESDQLVIDGTATGTTNIIAINGLGDVTVTDDITTQLPTVIVTEPSEGIFVGAGATSNAGEGHLILDQTDGESTSQNYIWTLNTLDTNTPIYKAEVSGYTQMPYANLLLGYEMLGTLHDRVGEQQTWAWDKCGTCQETQSNQIWARLRGNNTELTGEKRLDMEADQFVAQVGYDFDVRYNPDTGSRRHMGVMASYGRSDIDFFDRYRAENAFIAADKFTGEGKTDAASLGLYSTHYDKNGSYLDLVGQVSYLQNEYDSRNGVNVDQDGWGAGVSAEVGRPYKIGNSHWLIEPQAQLSYQFISLEDFNDGSAHVDQDDQHGLRGRLGARLAYNAPTADYRTKTFYAVANVVSDFIEPSDVTIGHDVLNEDYSRTWGEVGLGLQLPIAKSAYIYADARYQQELADEDRNGYTGTIGFKHSW